MNVQPSDVTRVGARTMGPPTSSCKSKNWYDLDIHPSVPGHPLCHFSSFHRTGRPQGPSHSIRSRSPSTDLFPGLDRNTIPFDHSDVVPRTRDDLSSYLNSHSVHPTRYPPPKVLPSLAGGYSRFEILVLSPILSTRKEFQDKKIPDPSSPLSVGPIKTTSGDCYYDVSMGVRPLLRPG